MEAVRPRGGAGDRQADPTFARSKFLAPSSPSRHVARAALRRRIDGEAPLVVVTGPPGSGKTALLAEWNHAAPPGRAAWFHVDESDRDSTRFWQAFLAAMHYVTIDARGGASLGARLRHSPRRGQRLDKFRHLLFER